MSEPDKQKPAPKWRIKKWHGPEAEPDEPQPVKPSRWQPVIIPAWLDDHELSNAQFRVFCRVARRCGNKKGTGQCFESLDSMAKGCHLNRETVQAALKWLVDCGLLKAEPRQGQPTIYQLSPYALTGTR